MLMWLMCLFGVYEKNTCPSQTADCIIVDVEVSKEVIY